MASNPRENEWTWSPNQIQETGTELARLYLQHVPYTHDYLVNEVVTDDFFFLNGNLTEKVYFLFSKSDQGSNYFLNSKIFVAILSAVSP